MTLQSPAATLIPLFSSSELTGCVYPGLLDRKNRSDMCSRWESNPPLPVCKASTLSTRPGSLPNCLPAVYNAEYHINPVKCPRGRGHCILRKGGGFFFLGPKGQ